MNFVLPLLSRTPIGGFRVVFEYADYLARHGHSVTIVYPRRWSTEPASLSTRIKDAIWPLKKALLDRPLVPWHSFHPSIAHRLVGCPSAANIPDADATIATAWQTAGPVAGSSSRKGRKFYLIQHYETWSGPKADVDATWLLPLHKIVIAKWLLDIGTGLGATDMRHIPNGLDFALFRLIEPLDGRPMSIVTMNHHEPFKGVPAALASLKSFHDRHPEIPVTMFGTMPKGPAIPDWIAYHQNPSQEFLVEKIYNGSSIYLGASVEEGWGLPPAEAMACGCAFVGTDIGGFREYAVAGHNALLSPPGDIDAMTANLLALADDPELRLTLQRGARDSIGAFTWDRAGSAFEHHLASGADMALPPRP